MNKPDWGTAPEWANYLAKDSNDCYYWYENKPHYNSKYGSWLVNIHDRRVVLAGCYTNNCYSEESLEQRPI